MSSKLKDAFTDFLRSQGLRLTPEREAIINEVARRKDHFDPEELHYTLKAEGLKVSRASVYRILPLLVEAGILKQAVNTDKHAHYENVFSKKHHDHMLCTRCGKVIEFFSSELEQLQDALCTEHGFTGESHTLEIMGLCKKCSMQSLR